jgi:hypothetical protein
MQCGPKSRALADGLRRPPAEFFKRGLGVGNAFVGDDFLVGRDDAHQLAGFDLDGADLDGFLSEEVRRGEEDSD